MDKTENILSKTTVSFFSFRLPTFQNKWKQVYSYDEISGGVHLEIVRLSSHELKMKKEAFINISPFLDK